MERNSPSTANNYTRILSFSWSTRPISLHSLLSGLLTDGCRLNSSEIIFFLFFLFYILLVRRSSRANLITPSQGWGWKQSGSVSRSFSVSACALSRRGKRSTRRWSGLTWMIVYTWQCGNGSCSFVEHQVHPTQASKRWLLPFFVRQPFFQVPFHWSVHQWLKSRLMYIKWPKNILLHYTKVVS